MTSYAQSGDYGYDTGHRDGATDLIADIRYQFSGEPGTAKTMNDLLEFFRTLTGDPELEWP